MDSRQIRVGGVAVGGGAPVSVQSMTNTKTEDVESTVAQILRLEAAGCDIVRVAVPTMEAAEAVEAIRERIHIPLVADIHFDYRLAVACAERGADKIRINPGNIGGEDRVRAVVEACRSRNIPIRIGVNAGSLEPALLEKYGGPTPEAMTESAMGHVRLLNRFGFEDICISVKASSVPLTVAAYRMLRQETDYPLHLGVTEAGTEYAGLVKSAVGIGTLLSEGIGDTIRVSLTAPPEREVTAGIAILKAAGLRRGGVEFISCPSCGRCRIDLIRVASEAEERLRGVSRDITVAVMGCAVNGPGEASRADFGIAGGDGEGVLFRKGQVVKKVPNDRLVDELMELIGSTPEEEKRKEERG
ncbi:MAG: flavodoxin-dependent (E)-4-hydroxy-3-methylbut-2-enyl-diphosphate synthase [Oscillospiraceae bacterium]|nr:flavodoxin-dependent (E)-4-hydroxy-3-methylbut-2-enyl-diphosphate synthase [Oscillospiraceae bacterium]